MTLPQAADEEMRRSQSLPATPVSVPHEGSASEADSLEAQLAAVRAQAKAMASVRATSGQLNGARRHAIAEHLIGGNLLEMQVDVCDLILL